MQFTELDYFILIFYLVGVTVFGAWLGRKQTSTRDYFLGGHNLPWPAVLFSVVATETSTLTFISVPGLAYLGNLNFLQITFGYFLGRIVISFILLPAYYRGELSTAYALLGTRFGSNMRNFSSAVFQITRLLADGVRLFATAIPLSVITGWSYPVSIAVIAVLTILYTYIGGIKAVVWMDVIQMFVYIGGALAAAYILLQKLPEGWQTVISAAGPGDKMQIFYSGFEKSWREFFTINYTFITGILGGAFLSMASHGTDQLIVQRLLTCRNLRHSQYALIGSGAIVIVQFALFLAIGLMLYAFYGGAAMRSDEVFPRFIVEGMPPGLSGLVIAGVFAAAMSTLSGSLNSLASATVMDIYKSRWGQANSPEKDLRISRWVTAIWGIVFIAGAMFFQNKEHPVVELGLGIASFTYGGLLGTFFLGSYFPRVREKHALIAMWAAIFFMTWLISQPLIIRLVLIGLNLLAGLWIFFKTPGMRLRAMVLILAATITTAIVWIPALKFAWPWYVFIGTWFTLILGNLLTFIDE